MDLFLFFFQETHTDLKFCEIKKISKKDSLGVRVGRSPRRLYKYALEINLTMKHFFTIQNLRPDIILCGLLGSKNQLKLKTSALT